MGIYIGHTSKYSRWRENSNLLYTLDRLALTHRTIRRSLSSPSKLAVGVDRWTCQTRVVNAGPLGMYTPARPVC